MRRNRSDFWCALVAGMLSATLDAGVVRFVVRVPSSTPVDAVVYLAGDRPELGAWRPDGVRLARDGENWVGSLQIPDGPMAWKATLGSWHRAEVTASGEAISNRTAIVSPGSTTISFEVLAWGSAPTSTATGDLRTLGPIASKDEAIAARTLTVRLPKGYDDASQRERRYPVLYMLDGQNVFDAATSFSGVEWQADETIDRLVHAHRIEETIVVAIPHSPRRIDELTFQVDPGPKRGGDGERFLRWLVEDAKRAVDERFRTRRDAESTTLVGSSLGGLFALEAILRRGDVFGRAIAMSPSLWWANEALLRAWEARDSRLPAAARLWIDMGTAEGRDGSSAHVGRLQRLAAVVERRGVAGVRTMIEEGAAHSETAWAARLAEALQHAAPRPQAP